MMANGDSSIPDRDTTPTAQRSPRPIGKPVGELRVFLGAAPGVGKTYAMLREGHRLRQDGHDIVIGFVEAHGRGETEAEIGDLEVIPRKRVEYRSVIVEEMDVDALLARAPEIALVDELAHTNAPGSVRQKRWQDVDVLRQAGIDVITTLNIQHINELADVVAGITGVTVHETIPYSVLEHATDVRLIDLPVDDLVARLERGKIYPPGRARQALENFFRPANLAALRELALRWTAVGVDEHLTDMMLQSERGAVEASERVMVVMTDHVGWGGVLRNGWRLASALRSDLDILMFRPPHNGGEGAADLPETTRAFRQLAEDLGGNIVELDDVGDEASRDDLMIDALLTHHTTILVLGVSRKKSRWGRGDRLEGLRMAQLLLLAVPRVDVHLVLMEA